MRALHKVFDGDRREMNARAKEIVQSDVAGPAVRMAVEAVQAAVAKSIAVSTGAAYS